MSSKTNRVEYFIDPDDWFKNKANVVNMIPPVSIHRPITRKLAAQIANKQQKPTVEHTEAIMEKIDRMDEEIEMEDTEDWSVVDIDSFDKKNELTVVEYIDDIYAYYKKAEFELMEENLYLTMNLIDRFLAVQSVIRKKLQLIGITALLLACKYKEVFVPVVQDLILISDKAYARKKVLEMLVSFYLIELCLVEYEMLRFPPSMLAAATVFIAKCTLGVSREWNATWEKHNNYDKNQILECSKLMVSFHQKAAVGKLTGVHQKYSTSKYGNASRCEPTSFLLEAWF
ncbi:putative U-box domain-containing protein 15-like [Capsicum annuum]|nr:putative U-box domain-containing protein 15-like [Capsicum annuum]